MTAPHTPDWRYKLGVPGSGWSSLGPVDKVKGLLRAQWDASQYWTGKLADQAAKPLARLGVGAVARPLLRTGAKALPLVGSAIALRDAANDFEHGRIAAGIANAVGVVPGPIGWAGLLAGSALDLFGDDATHFEQWAPPDGVATHMLPGAAKDVAHVAEADAALTAVQKSIFGFQDGPGGTVWNADPPAALRVDTPEVKNALDSWLAGIADQFREIENAMASTGEPYFEQWRQKLQPHFTAMQKLPEHSKEIAKQLTAASDAAGAWYAAMLDANHQARKQLTDAGTLHDPAPSTNLTSTQKNAQQKITAAGAALGDIGGANKLTPPAPVSRTTPARHGTPGQQPPAAAPTPAPAPAATPAKENAKDDPSGLLSQLAGPHPGLGSPLGGAPLAGHGLGGGIPLGGGPLGGAPLVQPVNRTPLGAQTPKPHLATERPNLSAPPKNKTVDPAPAPAPDQPGKTQVPGPGAKPAGNNTPGPTAVEVHGRKVTFPDAKKAALARQLAAGGPGNLVSLADAATKAELIPPVPGQDPGQQVAPSEAKPGDLLRAGDKDYLLLDKGEFLDFAAGKVVGADQIPTDLGPGGGYFRLRDAVEAGQAGPVSGPAPATTTFTVDHAAEAPAEASPAPPAPVPSVPSSGTPGVPGKGPAGSGPANAAATEPGRGAGGLSRSARPLDPSAIR